MISFLYIIALGLVLGMRHATDPDHVIAVTTIVSRQRSLRGAALIGTFWGIGHTCTMLLVGGAIVLLGWAVPPRMGLWMEFAVALMLVLLGALNLTGILRWFTEKMSGIEHGLTAHEAAHSHGGACDGNTNRQPSKMGFYQTVRPFVVGIVHGLAGSAAIALLVLATITQSSMGHRLPAGFWGRNDRGHDPDYGRHRRADYLRAQAFAEDEFELPACFRRNQFGVWTLPGLSHRVCERIVYGPSAVDAALIGKRSHRIEFL